MGHWSWPEISYLRTTLFNNWFTLHKSTTVYSDPFLKSRMRGNIFKTNIKDHCHMPWCAHMEERFIRRQIWTLPNRGRALSLLILTWWQRPYNEEVTIRTKTEHKHHPHQCLPCPSAVMFGLPPVDDWITEGFWGLCLQKRKEALHMGARHWNLISFSRARTQASTPCLIFFGSLL